MTGKTYRIGEAAARLNLKTYVLRFWEMEFLQIAPLRTEKGQRLYTEADLSVLGRIRYLLHERGLTIEGARRLLREEAEKGVVYAGLADDAPVDGAVDPPDDPPDEAADDPPDDPPDEAADDPPEDAPDDAAGERVGGRNADMAAVVSELRAIRRLLAL